MNVKKFITLLVVVLLLTGFTAMGIKSAINTSDSLKVHKVQLKNTELELQQTNKKLEDAKNNNKSSQEQIQKLEQEKKNLEDQLQAKIEQKQRIAEAAKKATSIGVATVYAAPVYSGSHEDWMAAAGIQAGDFSYVDYIISHESSWNPSAINALSGACGLPQSLPCSKLGPNWSDPVVGLTWANTYALNRYGSWAAAYSFWVANKWW